MRFRVVFREVHGRTTYELGPDKWPMPANQDYPCRGIIDSSWPGPDFLGIELVARGSFLVSNTFLVR